MSLLDEGVRGFLLDMDGTVYLSNQLLPGAEDFLALGLDVGIDQIFTSGDATHRDGNCPPESAG